MFQKHFGDEMCRENVSTSSSFGPVECPKEESSFLLSKRFIERNIFEILESSTVDNAITQSEPGVSLFPLRLSTVSDVNDVLWAYRGTPPVSPVLEVYGYNFVKTSAGDRSQNLTPQPPQPPLTRVKDCRSSACSWSHVSQAGFVGALDFSSHAGSPDRMEPREEKSSAPVCVFGKQAPVLPRTATHASLHYSVLQPKIQIYNRILYHLRITMFAAIQYPSLPGTWK